MVTYFESSLDTISVHHVGNSSQNEMYALSEQPLALKDDVIGKLLMQYFLTPFEKTNEVYHLMHDLAALDPSAMHRVDHITDHWPARNRHQHLRQIRAHPLALAGRQFRGGEEEGNFDRCRFRSVLRCCSTGRS